MQIVAACFFYSCSTDKEIVAPAQAFSIYVPANLATSVPQPDNNIATSKGVALGKKLFFDPGLSGNGKVSCATCHHAKLAFADGLSLSDKGVSGKKLMRSAPPLFNLAWAKGYFADGGAKNLESQVFAPLQSPDEMHQDLNELVKKLKQSSDYPSLFKEAFGEDTITTNKIAWALAQFERTLISAGSKYDKWIRKEGESLNDLELQGLTVFMQKCETCHKTDFFTDFDYHNNGIDSIFNDSNHENVYKGRYRITAKPEDIGKFKTPSLRNLSFTAPYMHDGRFATIDEVLQHYNSSVIYSATLDEKIPVNGFQLSDQDLKALKTFLKTLDDYNFVSQAMLMNPN